MSNYRTPTMGPRNNFERYIYIYTFQVWMLKLLEHNLACIYKVMETCMYNAAAVCSFKTSIQT